MSEHDSSPNNEAFQDGDVLSQLEEMVAGGLFESDGNIDDQVSEIFQGEFNKSSFKDQILENLNVLLTDWQVRRDANIPFVYDRKSFQQCLAILSALLDSERSGKYTSSSDYQKVAQLLQQVISSNQLASPRETKPLLEIESADEEIKISCPRCGVHNSIENQFCGACGNKLREIIDDTKKA